MNKKEVIDKLTNIYERYRYDEPCYLLLAVLNDIYTWIIELGGKIEERDD